ncbi:MAG: hypothetical protein WCH04_05125 [Gammaproteobacteria bacterium]
MMHTHSVPLTLCLSFLIFIGFTDATSRAADVVPNEVQMSGTQPNEVGKFESPDKCDNCHAGYNNLAPENEPTTGWRGATRGIAGFTGNDSFTYEARDNNGGVSAAATVNIPATGTMACGDYTGKGACNGEPGCVWQGCPKNGSGIDAAVCSPTEAG